jgi:hypothetical protein
MTDISDLNDAEHAIRERIQARLGDPPRQHKKPEELSPAEVDRHRRTGELPETDEFRSYERQVRRAAGLAISEEAGADKSPAALDRKIRKETR